MSLMTLIFGDANKKTIKELEPILAKINDFEAKFKELSDEELKAKTADFRSRLGLTKLETGDWKHQHDLLAEAKILDSFLPEAFAVIR